MSDGTATGTYAIELSTDDPNQSIGSSVGIGDPLGQAGRIYAVIGGSVYFSAHSHDLGFGLFRIDSSTLQPTLLTSGVPIGAGTPFAAGNKVYFIANSGARNLCVTDGTVAGTTVLTSLVDPPPWAAAFGNTLFFSTINAGQGGQELWLSDGTVAGTHLAFDVNPGGSSAPAYLTTIGNSLFFSVDDGQNGRELWRFGSPIITRTQINDGSAQRSMVNSISLTFNGLVTFSGNASNAFSMVGPGGSVSIGVDFSGSTSTQTVAKLTFSGAGVTGGSLADGNYVLVTNSSLITDGDGLTLDGDFDGTAGGNHAMSLFRLFGDVNGDRRVDVGDFGAFSLAYGSSIGNSAYVWYFDYNNDGHIDVVDYGQFNARYGMYLAP